MQFDKYKEKLMENLVSVKCAIFVVSSVFLLLNKITSDNWVNLSMALAGFHTINTASAIFKNVKRPLPRGDEIDNPDKR